MKPIKKIVRSKCRGGAALIISMIFVLIFSSLAVSMACLSGNNVQIANNHHKFNSALSAAQSALECGKYIVANTPLPSTSINIVTTEQANNAWNTLCARVQTQPWVAGQAGQTENQIVTNAISFGQAYTSFQVKFYRSDTYTIKLTGIGSDGQITKQVSINMKITKNNEVLNYAIASRGRMWLTGDTTIHGNLFSSWDRADISPYNMTSDSRVEGNINTVLTLPQIEAHNYQLETLDANDMPVFDEQGNRIYSQQDEIQAYHEGINYEQPFDNMPGMSIDDYNTDEYNIGLTSIPSCPSSQRVMEYFPHAAGNYSQPRDSSSTSFTRHVYEDQTFTDALLPLNRHALFRNCTFEDVLYIDCSKTSTSKSYTNNIRFENCTFNGTIVTNVPRPFNWRNNCLYFTGEASFNNQSAVQEATILAPHFNVNLGNTNPQQSDNNVLTGAIVGGIVDVRGNAQIYGTIISMFDTTPYSSGYVTNIGATLDDGGSETTELGDIGVIEITPGEDKMLPSGVISPIVIKPLQNTYCES